MAGARLDNRTHAAALTAFIYDGEGARELTGFLGDADRGAYERCVDDLAGHADDDGSSLARRTLRALISSEKFSGIAEIHPAWILEALKDESPRIIGIILRYLPSRHVRYVLKHLPPDVRNRMPKLVEAFAVPGDVLDVIRNTFESRFLPIHISKSHERFGFEHLHFLKGEELEQLFVELGLCEMALALDGMSEKMLNVLLNRLELKDAKRLHSRMQDLKGMSADIKRQARYAILETEDENVGSDQLLVDIGLGSLARAMAHENSDLFPVMRQKLSPHVAYTLKRMIDECSSACSPQVVEERKRLVLQCIARLAQEHRIDTQWERFADLP